MLRLVREEFTKLRGSWFLVILLAGASLAPVFALAGAWTNANNDVRNVFNFEALLTQFFLNATLLFHPLMFGVFGAFILQREYQNRTLSALLLVPWSRSELLSAKLLFLAGVSLVLVTYALVLALVLGAVTGAKDFSWDLVVTIGVPVFGNWFVGLPCLVAVLAVTMATRNLVAGVAFALGALFVGVETVTAGDAAFFNPWAWPFVLTANERLLMTSGIDLSLVPRTWVGFVVFTVVSLGAAYALFERSNPDPN